MNKSAKFVIGERVKIVPQHRLRGGEIRRLVRFKQRFDPHEFVTRGTRGLS